MRKIKSTALLGAFVAVASVGAISHEAHGGTITTPTGAPTIISKEMLPNPSATFQAFIVPSVGFSGSSITLTVSGATFTSGYSYTISSASCNTSAVYSGQNSLTFTSCSVSSSSAYSISTSGAPAGTFYLSVPASSSSIVLYYSSNGGDTPTSQTIAQVQQQLTYTANAGIAYINPSSLSTFDGGNGSGSSASNSVTLLNSEYGNNSTWSNTINPSYTMSFVFTNIPSSVSSVSSVTGQSSTTPVNGSATVSYTLTNIYPPFSSSSSATLSFKFSNSNNVSISTGTISLSSIVGSDTNNSGSSVSYAYLSTTQPFLTFTLGATQIYVPDALASYSGNVIQYSYITISMPSSASIASISVLNNPNASCSVPSTSNGLLVSTSTTGQYYIDLGKLAASCTGLTPTAWQSGVPLVITIGGTNATPNNITADAYAVFLGHLKRIPVDVLNSSSVGAGTQFSY